MRGWREQANAGEVARAFALARLQDGHAAAIHTLVPASRQCEGQVQQAMVASYLGVLGVRTRCVGGLLPPAAGVPTGLPPMRERAYWCYAYVYPPPKRASQVSAFRFDRGHLPSGVQAAFP